MSLNVQDKLHLKHLLKELKLQKALHTEFVSVYIPADYDIIKIIQHLAEEQGTASNIKSATTRKNVQSALEKMIQHLRLFPKTPPNGLAVFTGNVAATEGKQDMRVWSIEPPVPLNIRLYRCDKNFVTDILEDMLTEKEVYGLVVLDHRDATLALLRGKSIITLTRTHSEVPGKMRAGGQCLLPDTLVRRGKREVIPISKLNVGDKVLSYSFQKDVAVTSKVLDKWNVTKKVLYEIEIDKIIIKCSSEHTFFVKRGNGIIEIPAKDLNTKDIVFTLNDNHMKEERKISKIKNKQGKFELIDISVKNQNFIANGVFVHNSAPRFARARELANKMHYKKIADYMIEQFLPLGNNLKGIIIGGPGVTVNDFLNHDYITGELKKKIIGTKDLSYTDDFGLQELLDKSTDLLEAEEVAREKKIMERFFKQLLDNPGKVTYGEKETLRALEMNAVDTLLLSENLPEDQIFKLEEQAAKGGTEVKIISTETREGVQLKEMGGIAALLRFEIG